MRAPFGGADRAEVDYRLSSTIDPPLGEWRARIDRWRAERSKIDFPIDSEPYADLAARAKSEATLIALDFARSKSIAPPKALHLGAPIVATGHQPYLHHCGVASKTLAIRKLIGADRGELTGLNVIVDSDPVGSTGRIAIPKKSGSGIEPVMVDLFGLEADRLIESSRPVSIEKFNSAIEIIGELLKTDRLNETRGAFESFIARLKSERDLRSGQIDYLELTLAMKALWERELDGETLLEAPISALAGSNSFRRFARSIIADIERFGAVYNDALERYRLRRKLRYRANPFPNLRLDRPDGSLETPFWRIDADGARSPLFLERSDRGAYVLPDETRIRPKALILTLYVRLFIADFFVHGTGGAKYDQVTDEIMRDYFQIEPPPIGVVSVDQPLLDSPVDLPDRIALIDDEIDRLNRLRREIEQHPEKHLDQLDGAGDELIALKARALAEIKGSDGARKKEIAARIKELNHQMRRSIAPLSARIERELESFIARRAELSGLSYRKYPYFFHSAARIYSQMVD